MIDRLEQYRMNIIELCKGHHVQSLYAFGSVLTDKFNTESDIDLIVRFTKMPSEDYADNYCNLKFCLQDILKREVDLLEEQAIKSPYFKLAIDKQKEIIYA
jgi:uncharacterized protein